MVMMGLLGSVIIFEWVCVCSWLEGVSVGMYLALATGHGNVNEAAGVEDTLVGAALGLLLLLLGLDLYSGCLLGCWRLINRGGDGGEGFTGYLPWEWQP
jgi:hypothetical protein